MRTPDSAATLEHPTGSAPDHVGPQMRDNDLLGRCPQGSGERSVVPPLRSPDFAPTLRPQLMSAENKRMELTTANRDLAVAIDRGRSSSVERCPASKSERALLSTL